MKSPQIALYYNPKTKRTYVLDVGNQDTYFLDEYNPFEDERFSEYMFDHQKEQLATIYKEYLIEKERLDKEYEKQKSKDIIIAN
jgi:hypothetical protein